MRSEWEEASDSKATTGQVPVQKELPGGGDHGRRACQTCRGVGQNGAFWRHWADDEMPGRLGTTGSRGQAVPSQLCA